MRVFKLKNQSYNIALHLR